MKKLWSALIEKYGSWWVGIIIGDIEYSFVCHPDYAHHPKSIRRRAASEAVTASLSHRSFWIALVLMIGLIVSFSLIDTNFGVSDGNGTLGALLGFLFGGALLARAIYTAGLDTYTAGLPIIQKETEQVGAGDAEEAV